MRKTHLLEIKKPCMANMDIMEKTKNGFFCNLCSKEVVDFSNKNEKELRKVFSSNSENNICGKFNNQQISTNNSNKYKFSIPLKYVFLASLLYGKNVFSQTVKNESLKNPISNQNHEKPCTRIVLGMPSRIQKDTVNFHVFTIKSELIFSKETKSTKDISLYFLGSTIDAKYDESSNKYISDVELEKDFVNFYVVISYKEKTITKIFPFDSKKIINKTYLQNVLLTIEDIKKLEIK